MMTTKINPEDLTKEKLKETLSEIFYLYATEDYENRDNYDFKTEIIMRNFQIFLRENVFDYSKDTVACGLLTYQIMHHPFHETNKYENAVIALNTATKLFLGERKKELEQGFTKVVFDKHDKEMDRMLAYMNFFEDAFKEEEKTKANQQVKKKRKNKKRNRRNKYE